MIVPEEQLVKDVVGVWELETVPDTNAERLTDAQVVGEKLKSPELQNVPVTDVLDVDER